MTPLLLHLCANLTAACIAGIWQGIGLIAIGITLTFVLQRASAALQHTMLLVLFAGGLILPWTGMSRPTIGIEGGGLRLAPWGAGIIAVIWFAVTMIRATQLFRAWRHLCSVRRNSIALQVNGIEELCGGRRCPVLCRSSEVDSPSVVGLGEPRLLIPEWMLPSLSMDDLRQITLHECEHLRRYDDWINFSLQVAIMLSPLNPALLWLEGRIRIQRELAVDAAVVATTAKPLSYAACLTRLAEQRREHGRLRLVLAAWERKSELVQRVHSLIHRPTLWTKRQSAWATGIISVALLVVATGMANTPQLVEVTDTYTEHPVASSLTAPANLADSDFSIPARTGLVPVSFKVTSGKSEKTDSKPKSRSMKNGKGISRYSKSMLPSHGARYVGRNPFMLMRRNSGQGTDGDLIRTRPVRHSIQLPYLAVPVSSGWLLIEL